MWVHGSHFFTNYKYFILSCLHKKVDFLSENKIFKFFLIFLIVDEFSNIFQKNFLWFFFDYVTVFLVRKTQLNCIQNIFFEKLTRDFAGILHMNWLIIQFKILFESFFHAWMIKNARKFVAKCSLEYVHKLWSLFLKSLFILLRISGEFLVKGFISRTFSEEKCCEIYAILHSVKQHKMSKLSTISFMVKAFLNKIYWNFFLNQITKI